MCVEKLWPPKNQNAKAGLVVLCHHKGYFTHPSRRTLKSGDVGHSCVLCARKCGLCLQSDIICFLCASTGIIIFPLVAVSFELKSFLNAQTDFERELSKALQCN